jgi:ABC-type nitrate/sulfonate/bicarbonate transport system permease component
LDCSPGTTVGWVDVVLMRVVDVMLDFPGILLALGIVAVPGPSLTSLMIAVGISSIPTYARLTRASVLSARENLYVDAARIVGARDSSILLRHILPNVVAPIIIGSDAAWRLTRFETFARELEEMASAGLSALEAIQAATGAASQATGHQDEFGTLRARLIADLLLVDGNAAEDIHCLASVRRVYLEGQLMVVDD